MERVFRNSCHCSFMSAGIGHAFMLSGDVEERSHIVGISKNLTAA